MLTDAQCADYAASCYWNEGAFDLVIKAPLLQWTGIKILPDCILVAKRGSSNIPDWIRDFRNIALMTHDKLLRSVHPGFLEWLRPTRAQYPQSDLPWVYTGHSLGAGEAALDAAEGVLLGQKVAKVCVFGPPRPGGSFIRETLQKVPEKAFYKNRNDPVADVPFDIPLFEPYQEACELTHVDVRPPMDDEWGLPFLDDMPDHHMQLYWMALHPGEQRPAWMPGL